MASTRQVRLIGAVVGLGVGAALTAVSIATSVPDTSFPPSNSFLAGVLVAGAVGGALFAPLAWGARRWTEWLGVVVGLAIAAVVLGDVVVVMTTLIGARIDASTGTPTDVVSYYLTGLALIVLGLFVVGPFAGPIALVASSIWALVMWVIRRLRPGAPATAT
jgi:hypothetical protein